MNLFIFQILQFPIHSLPKPSSAQDRRPVPELRRHPAQLPSQSRDKATTYKGHPAEAVQADYGCWGVSIPLERP